jgi:hypothetical protein
MLPFPTDPRRLLMMVRVFLHEFSEFVGAHRDGLEYPSDPRDDCADHQLEAFLERLAVDARQIDDGFRRMAERVETAAEVQQSLEGHLRDLLWHAAWSRNRISRN